MKMPLHPEAREAWERWRMWHHGVLPHPGRHHLLHPGHGDGGLDLFVVLLASSCDVRLSPRDGKEAGGLAGDEGRNIGTPATSPAVLTHGGQDVTSRYQTWNERKSFFNIIQRGIVETTGTGVPPLIRGQDIDCVCIEKLFR